MFAMTRRRWLGTACLTAIGLASKPAIAQATFPSKPIKIIVPFAPGGPTDTSARIVATNLSANLGVPVMVENVPGAGAVIGTMRVVTAPADGYTLLWGTPSSLTVGPSVNAEIKYDPNTAFATVSQVVSAPFVLAVRPDLGLKNLASLIAYAKAHPGKLNYGSTGVGGSAHMLTEYFMQTAGITATHIPYNGGAPMVMGLRQGAVDLLFDTPTTVAPLIQSSAGTALGVTSLKRWPELPDVKTLDESGMKGFEVVTWFGLLAPRNTPSEVVNTLSQGVIKSVAGEDVRKALRAAGLETVASTPSEFAERIRIEGIKWSEIAKTANIKL
ncbi:MAG: tripartite tricarboxylate transporter substrate binding protein [Burkholderiaceae bacterium]|jgi:tripartite-type tricarboxylate transporter receptor subunit TctC|nr:tripartite tricarboxylate transporter substrate binding protein [Burkholderiaceae bacterium]